MIAGPPLAVCMVLEGTCPVADSLAVSQEILELQCLGPRYFNLLQITLLASGVLRWLVHFWKI